MKRNEPAGLLQRVGRRARLLSPLWHYWWQLRAVTAPASAVWGVLLSTLWMPTLPRVALILTVGSLTFWLCALPSYGLGPASVWRSSLVRRAFLRAGLAAPSRVRELKHEPSVRSYAITLRAGETASEVSRRASALASCFRSARVEVEPSPRRADRLELLILEGEPPAPSGPSYLPRCAGVTDYGPAIWNPLRSPHVLVVGDTGSGKTTAITGLAASLVLDKWDWTFAFIDLKAVSFGSLAQEPRVVGCAIDPVPASGILRRFAADVFARRELLVAAGVDHWTALPAGTLRPVLIVVDETTELLTAGSEDESPKEKRDRIEQVRADLATLARLGRFVGLHLVLGLQRPDAAVLGGELRDNLRCRVALGWMSADGLRMVFPDGVPDLSISGEPGVGLAIGLEGRQGVTRIRAPRQHPDALRAALRWPGCR